MSDRRKKILGMLAEGKIAVDEAERLLEAVELDGEGTGAEGGRAKNAHSDAPRYVHVHVEEKDGENINIRFPLKLLRAGMRLGSLLPERAREILKENGIDLSAKGADIEEVIASLAELSVDVNGPDAHEVRIYCE